MKTIETTQTAGPDKLLHVTVPVDEANRKYRLVIVLEPESEVPSPSEKKTWPPGFIESTYGSIQDESFIRQPQGECQDRLEFE